MSAMDGDRMTIYLVGIVRCEKVSLRCKSSEVCFPKAGQHKAGQHEQGQPAQIRWVSLWGSAKLAAAWVEGFNQEVQLQKKPGPWAVLLPTE